MTITSNTGNTYTLTVSQEEVDSLIRCIEGDKREGVSKDEDEVLTHVAEQLNSYGEKL